MMRGGKRLLALGRVKAGGRNRTEAAYEGHLQARLMAGDIQWFAFGRLSLKIGPNTHVRPDFAVMAADGVLEMHDTKGGEGVIQDDFWAKYKVAAEMFPFRFVLAFPADRAKSRWRYQEVGV